MGPSKRKLSTFAEVRQQAQAQALELDSLQKRAERAPKMNDYKPAKKVQLSPDIFQRRKTIVQAEPPTPLEFRMSKSSLGKQKLVFGAITDAVDVRTVSALASAGKD